MSIPKQRSMTLKRGFGINANVDVDSPQQSNAQSVSVSINNNLPNYGISTQRSNQDVNALTRDVPIELPTQEDIECYPSVPATVNTSTVFAPPMSDKGDVVITNASNTPKHIYPVVPAVEDLLNICKDKDSLITALSLIVDIYQHNPTMINKYIIAKEDTLLELLHCLTNADEIQFSKQDVVSGSCLCKGDHNYCLITKIMIKKDNQSFNFKYSYPNVIQFLEDRNISWKMCC